MDGQIDPSSPGGKLFCNHCEQKVGEYCWMGLRCGCGELCAPGVALTRKKSVSREWRGWELCEVDDDDEEWWDLRSGAPSPGSQGRSKETQDAHSTGRSTGVEESQESHSQHEFLDGDPASEGSSISGPNIKEGTELNFGSSRPEAIFQASEVGSSTCQQQAPQCEHSELRGEESRFGTAADVLRATPKDKKHKKYRLPRAIQVSRAPRRAHHLPISPSPLRKTWKPGSSSSSQSSAPTSPSPCGLSGIGGAEFDSVCLPTHFFEYNCPVQEARLPTSSMDGLLSRDVPEDHSETTSIVGVPWLLDVYGSRQESHGMSLPGESEAVSVLRPQDINRSIGGEAQATSFVWEQNSQSMSTSSDSHSMSVVEGTWLTEELTNEDAPYELIEESQAILIVSEAERQRLLQSSILLDEINVFEDIFWDEQ